MKELQDVQFVAKVDMRIETNLIFFLRIRKNQNVLICIFLLICSVFFLLCSLSANNIKEILNAIPIEDKQILQKMFYRMMHHDHFSYTLFGDKPVSLSSDFILTPIGNTMCKMKPGGLFWKKWAVWKKYEHLFQMWNFLLIDAAPKGNVKDIFFINKKLFIQKVNQHLDLFKEALGETITSQDLLQEIERTQDFFSVIKENNFLLGLLLGYGEHNSRLFYERDRLFRILKSKKFPKLPHKIPEPGKNFSSIGEELNSLHSRLVPFGDYSYSPVIAKPVHFVAEPEHPETKQLEKKYWKLRNQISAIYAQGDFLEITLSKLVSQE